MQLDLGESDNGALVLGEEDGALRDVLGDLFLLPGLGHEVGAARLSLEAFPELAHGRQVGLGRDPDVHRSRLAAVSR